MSACFGSKALSYDEKHDEKYEMAPCVFCDVSHMDYDVSHMVYDVSNMVYDVSHMDYDVSHMVYDVSHMGLKNHGREYNGGATVYSASLCLMERSNQPSPHNGDCCYFVGLKNRRKIRTSAPD